MAEDQQTGAPASAGGREWLARMPGRVAAQRALLEHLLDAAEAEPAFRWLELGGSLARDAGDELSDIDAGLGIADSQWPAAVASVEEVIGRAGPAADSFRQPFPGQDGQTGWHLFTLYETGLQLSLVVLPSSWRAGLPPLAVALYDADGQLSRPWTRHRGGQRRDREGVGMPRLAGTERPGEVPGPGLGLGSARQAGGSPRSALEALGAGHFRPVPRLRSYRGAGYSGFHAAGRHCGDDGWPGACDSAGRGDGDREPAGAGDPARAAIRAVRPAGRPAGLDQSTARSNVGIRF